MREFLKEGIPPLPLEIISKSSAFGSFWTAGERRSGMFKLLPTSEPAPSGPWHIAHFDRNSVALPALSCPPSAPMSAPVNATAATANADRIADLLTTRFRALF